MAGGGKRRRKKQPFVLPVKNCVHCGGSGWEEVADSPDHRVRRCQCIKKQLDALIRNIKSDDNKQKLHDDYFREHMGLQDTRPVRDGKSRAYKNGDEED